MINGCVACCKVAVFALIMDCNVYHVLGPDGPIKLRNNLGILPGTWLVGH
jgi:hypothetical protein